MLSFLEVFIRCFNISCFIRHYNRIHWIRAVASMGPGGPGPLDKVLAPLVGLGRYIESFKNKKFSNKNTLVHIKNFTSFRGKAYISFAPDSYIILCNYSWASLIIAPKYKNFFQFTIKNSITFIFNLFQFCY